MTDSRDTLSLLYPWQRADQTESLSTSAELLDSIRGKADDSARIKQQFFADHAEDLLRAAQALAAVFAGGGRLFTMGNGGSSCDAQHIAVEFNHPVTTGRPALPAQCMVNDVAMLTAVANDVGIGHVFVRQLIAQGRSGDALVGLSTSGNSPNLIAAFEQARSMGMLTIALSGGNGGQMADSAVVDLCLTVATDSIHRVQETHVAVFHILWDVVHTLLGEQTDRGGRSS